MFEALTMLSEGGLVDMTVYPVAVLEVEVDETINDVYVREHSEEIAVVIWRLLEFLDLMAGLPVVRIIMVLWRELNEDWRGHKEAEQTISMWVAALVGPA